MNNIVTTFNFYKHAKSVEDILLKAHPYGRNIYDALPKNENLHTFCARAGREIVRLQYVVEQKRKWETILDAEKMPFAECLGTMFQAVILAGDLKTIYQVKDTAVDFINATGFSQELDEKFFADNFSKPVVLYTTGVKSIFDDITCILMFYDAELRRVNCIYSVREDKDFSREFGRPFKVEDLCGVFKRDQIVVEDDGVYERMGIRRIPELASIDLEETLYQAMLFALKFVLLRQSDKQPLVSESQYKSFRDPKKEYEIRGYVNHQLVSLTTKYVNAMKSWKPTDRMELDKEGKIQKTIEVHGFVRRQHYGTGNLQVKYVYIESHDRQAWVKEGIRIIHVVP